MKKYLIIALGLVLGSTLVPGTASQLKDLGFEAVSLWQGPWGYGAFGGQGQGVIMSSENGAFTRSGDKSLRLTVGDDGSPHAVAWAGTSHMEPCIPGSKVKAGAYFYYSSCDNPPTEGRAIGQLRLEYFQDREGQVQIPTHVSMSAPFTSRENCKSDEWHLVELYDRVPYQAKSMKYSILLLSQQPNGEKKEVWVDDPFLEVQVPKARTRGM